MSKDVIIQEGGRGKTITADKLRTALVGGGDCLWVPEDEVQVGEKVIDENGTYLAADDGLYGYSQVTVRGVGQVTGKDGAGNDAMAYVDPDTGRIMINELPSELRIITPPSHGIYTDGSIISLNGMALKAYYSNGTEWGVVPVNEVLPDPMYAHYDKSTDVPIGGIATSDLVPEGIEFNTGMAHWLYYDSSFAGQYYEADVIAAFTPEQQPDTRVIIRMGRKTSYAAHQYEIWRDGSRHSEIYHPGSYFEHDGKGCYYYGVNVPRTTSLGSWDLTDNPTPVHDTPEQVWTMLYGAITDRPAGSRVPVTVKWPRVGDGMELTATFEILVAPPYGDDDPAGALIPPTIDDIIDNITGG